MRQIDLALLSAFSGLEAEACSILARLNNGLATESRALRAVGGTSTYVDEDSSA